MKPRDKRLWCYKVAVVLLYGQVVGVERLSPGKVLVDTSLLANHLGLTNHRLRNYLKDLKELGVATSMSMGHGWTKLELATPEGWQVVGINNAGKFAAG